MTPVSTNIKIDPELKEQAQDLFESLGKSRPRTCLKVWV